MCPASLDLVFKFWDTLHISGMSIARDFKFGMRIDRHAYKPKMQSRSKGCPVDHVTYFSFRTSFDPWNDIHYVHRITSMSTSVIYFTTIMVRHGANFAVQRNLK